MKVFNMKMILFLLVFSGLWLGSFKLSLAETKSSFDKQVIVNQLYSSIGQEINYLKKYVLKTVCAKLLADERMQLDFDAIISVLEQVKFEIKREPHKIFNFILIGKMDELMEQCVVAMFPEDLEQAQAMVHQMVPQERVHDLQSFLVDALEEIPSYSIGIESGLKLTPLLMGKETGSITSFRKLKSV